MRWSTYLGHDNYFLTREVMVLDSFAQDDLRETIRVYLTVVNREEENHMRKLTLAVSKVWIPWSYLKTTDRWTLF